MTDSALLTDFVNTLHEGTEGLPTTVELENWLTAHELLPAGVRAAAADVAEVHATREALRSLLLANNGVEVDLAAATAVLDGAARRAQVELRFVDGKSVLVPEGVGVAGAIGQILAAVHALTADGSWARLKACRARDCEWAFVDNAKNQSRAWCSMSSCGNREKARAFRERRKPLDV
jgi:predicted RNA-binding Zn ribbon-like protein